MYQVALARRVQPVFTCLFCTVGSPKHIGCLMPMQVFVNNFLCVCFSLVYLPEGFKKATHDYFLLTTEKQDI